MYVVAGPNGAGKSTFSSRAGRMRGVTPIDADAIQRDTGMSSPAAWAEGLRRCHDAIAAHRDFLVETTLAGRHPTRLPTYLRLMRQARAEGYFVDLTFIALENPDAHVLRVGDRVAAGLHDIPEQLIRERYHRSISNMVEAIVRSHHALLIDNSSVEFPFRAFAEFDNGKLVARSNDVPTWGDLVNYIDVDRS